MGKYLRNQHVGHLECANTACIVGYFNFSITITRRNNWLKIKCYATAGRHYEKGQKFLMPKGTKIKEQCQEFILIKLFIQSGNSRIYPVHSTFAQNWFLNNRICHQLILSFPPILPK